MASHNNPPNHHCENPVLGDFFVSSLKFFFREGRGVLPLLGAEGPQKWGLRAEGARLTKIFVILEGLFFETMLRKGF